MKALILANSDVGLYKFRRELLEKLLSNGNEVVVALPDGKFIPDIIALGCKYIDVEFDRRNTNPVKDLALLNRYRALVKQEKPDVVLTYTIKPNVYGGLACRLTRTPCIANVTGLGTSIENPGLVQKIALILYWVGLRKAKCVFFQNEPNRAFFLQRVLTQHANTRVLPGSGVNLIEHCFEPYPWEDKGIRLLFIGRIMKDKGVEELFTAGERVKAKHPSVRFRLIGDCDEDYDGRIQELERAGIIESLGFQKNVHSYIKDSHCTILPSYHEGTTNALLESAACGRPVIATRVTGCSETFDDGITGLGCEVKSVDSLEAAIEQFILMSFAEHEAMGNAGRAKMEREYDRQIVVDAYLDEIRKAIKHSNI
ncbi:MAG: glycosyltransferase family 4 protein [Christensenella sp.]|nr:glycosyltransferase family 4 protein [Christensenella sp.]